MSVSGEAGCDEVVAITSEALRSGLEILLLAVRNSAQLQIWYLCSKVHTFGFVNLNAQFSN